MLYVVSIAFVYIKSWIFINNQSQWVTSVKIRDVLFCLMRTTESKSEHTFLSLKYAQFYGAQKKTYHKNLLFTHILM